MSRELRGADERRCEHSVKSLMKLFQREHGVHSKTERSVHSFAPSLTCVQRLKQGASGPQGALEGVREGRTKWQARHQRSPLPLLRARSDTRRGIWLRLPKLARPAATGVVFRRRGILMRLPKLALPAATEVVLRCVDETKSLAEPALPKAMLRSGNKGPVAFHIAWCLNRPN